MGIRSSTVLFPGFNSSHIYTLQGKGINTSLCQSLPTFLVSMIQHYVLPPLYVEHRRLIIWRAACVPEKQNTSMKS